MPLPPLFMFALFNPTTDFTDFHPDILIGMQSCGFTFY